MTARAAKNPHAAKAAHRRKGDIGPESEQPLEDTLYAQRLFNATPQEASPADQPSESSSSR